MKTVQATPEQMEARQRVSISSGSGTSSTTRSCLRRRATSSMREGCSRSPRRATRRARSPTRRLSGDVDFTFHVAECPPGQGPGLHAHHATTETFFCLDGRFRIFWGDHGEHEVTLDQWDTVSVPPGVVRGFRNVSDDVAHLLILVTGGVSDMNDIAMTPEYREKLSAFGPQVLPELEKTGLRFDAGVE